MPQQVGGAVVGGDGKFSAIIPAMNAELYKALCKAGVEASAALCLAKTIPSADTLAELQKDVRAVRNEQQRLADEAEREAGIASAIKQGRAERMRELAFSITVGLIMGILLILLQLLLFI